MKISQRRWLSAVQMAAVTGLAMLITGLGRVLLKRAAAARAKSEKLEKSEKPPKSAKAEQAAREEAEAKARMDGEGGSMQPVAVH